MQKLCLIRCVWIYSEEYSVLFRTAEDKVLKLLIIFAPKSQNIQFTLVYDREKAKRKSFISLKKATDPHI